MRKIRDVMRRRAPLSVACLLQSGLPLHHTGSLQSRDLSRIRHIPYQVPSVPLRCHRRHGQYLHRSANSPLLYAVLRCFASHSQQSRGFMLFLMKNGNTQRNNY